MNGKGDRNRARDYGAFRTNYDMIFGRCSRHPTYRPGTRRPHCDVCRRIWREERSGVEQLAARQAHNLEVGGSSPPPAT